MDFNKSHTDFYYYTITYRQHLAYAKYLNFMCVCLFLYGNSNYTYQWQLGALLLNVAQVVLIK